MKNMNSLIDALERELAGYIRRGLTDRADQVRAELRRLGSSERDTTEVVPPESAKTPQKAATRVRKPQDAPKEAEAPNTSAKRRKSAK